ncbi:TetR/AcrR family transcriptional regulator [Latilactobacillus graminis]|nr:TetR/AcrR family transcriptional regulator [Latilactobacillus graminis]QFP79151.1 TetR/AcrR family transcriptional regulator [Latilactobacillus graminis]
MARTKQIRAEQILDKAYEMVLASGLKSITARSLAKALNCSTQPIYLEFGNMGQLKQAILEQAKARLVWYVTAEQRTADALVNLGIGYVRFATIEPELYRALFIDNHFGHDEAQLFMTQLVQTRLQSYQPLKNKPEDEQRRIINEAWIVITGLATLINAKLVDYQDVEIEALLKRMLKRCFN